MADKPIPTPDELRQLLKYEPETGKLFWKERPVWMFAESKLGAKAQCDTWNSRRAGTEAFTAISVNGYRRGRVLKVNQQAHRVIWAIVTGAWPAQDIDHINRDRTDNRFCNLREVSRSQNLCNSSANKNSTSRFIGVSKRSRDNRWIAQVKCNGTQRFLGSFDDEEAAARAYDAGALELQGEFASLNFPR